MTLYVSAGQCVLISVAGHNLSVWNCDVNICDSCKICKTLKPKCWAELYTCNRNWESLNI